MESIPGIHMLPIRTVEQPICLKSVAQETISLLGKSHVLEILYTLSKRETPVRFNELKRSINITSTTLSRRLEELVDVGFLNREVFAEVPLRVEYSQSEKGKGLGKILSDLFSWMSENLNHSEEKSN